MKKGCRIKSVTVKKGKTASSFSETLKDIAYLVVITRRQGHGGRALYNRGIEATLRVG